MLVRVKKWQNSLTAAIKTSVAEAGLPALARIGDAWRSPVPKKLRHKAEQTHRSCVRLFGSVWVWSAYPVALIFCILFILAIVAAFSTLWRTLGGAESNLGTGALIVALLGAPILIWRTIVAQRTLNFQKENLMTDRIAKSVEQLGAEKTVKVLDGVGKTQERTEPNLEVRLGGILSLERIAQDSVAYDGGRDHVRVMEILCAYVRHNAAVPIAGIERDPVPPRADIALALSVIGRRSKEPRNVEARWGPKADPEATWPFDEGTPDTPKGADIETSELAFERWKKRFLGYRGYRLDLRSIDLRKADLSGGVFGGADMSEALFDEADCKSSVFIGASLANTKMSLTNLDFASFDRANLFGAKLSGATMVGTSLIAALFAETSFYRCEIVKARFDRAEFFLSYFENSWLEYSLFRHTNLSASNLTFAQIARTFGDASVTLPDGVGPQHPNWPAHWPRWVVGDLKAEWEKWRSNPSAYQPPPPPAAQSTPTA